MKKKLLIIFLFFLFINFKTSSGLDIETCGDNVCEGVETKYNCPEDCSSDLFGHAILGETSFIFGIGFLMLIIILIALIQIRKKV